jgi:general secretion pathway protein G
LSSQFRRFFDLHGFTLIEVMVAIVIVAILATVAIPNYISYREKAIMVRVISEMKTIEMEIISYSVENGEFPPDLATVDSAGLKDPWGRPYQYLPVEGTPPGQLRKDRFMVPVNTDFDLYSMGRDGKSRPPFTAKHSRDDIVRCNNGGYIGPVSEY